MRHISWSLVNTCQHVRTRHVIGRRGGTCQLVIRLKRIKLVVDVIVIVFTLLPMSSG